MLRLAFDFIITWRETRTRPNAYKIIVLVGSVGGANTHRLFSCFSLGLLHRLIFHFRRLIHFLLYMNDVIIPISLISKGYIVLQNTQRIVQSIRNPEFSS